MQGFQAQNGLQKRVLLFAEEGLSSASADLHRFRGSASGGLKPVAGISGGREH